MRIIGTRWVITQNDLHDSQKTKFKARFVAQGLLKPQRDSLTVSKESFKLLVTVAAYENFKLDSVDIQSDFLQAKTLDHEIYALPLQDVRKDGVAWRLLGPLYGLDYAS